jgi:hypothetical protein
MKGVVARLILAKTSITLLACDLVAIFQLLQGFEELVTYFSADGGISELAFASL